MRRTRHRAGFTLLEIIVAMGIFAGLAVGVQVLLQNSGEHVLQSARARELRMVAERKLGEIAVFEREFDEIRTDEKLDDYGEFWEDWTWSLDIRDVVIYGTTSDEAAYYLFGDPEEEEEDLTGDEPEEEPEGETQFLRELTLTVRAPEGITGDADSVSIVTFLPLVDYAATGAPAGGPPAGDGE